MKKLTVLSLVIFCTLVIFSKPTLASTGQADSWLSFFNWVFKVPTPPPTPSYPIKTVNPIVRQTATPRPTQTPTSKPTATPNPTTRSNSTPQPTSSGDFKRDYIMSKINDYRHSLGLSSVQIDSNTCNFASTRAKEISSGFNHDGFTNRINSHSLPYPSYHMVTENIAETPNYQDVETMWQNSPGHAENMRADTPYVCVESYGNFYAYEGWKP